ncbi:hypothetical protein Taro_027277 [Colocasia esculenta]|uniref:Uncharacterized protein n=1 Tax=Colocasia esculenta TaxID=4460 RepID=A0A843VE41_COLES|nr:hypothetical protein [Colocasia esculenta]
MPLTPRSLVCVQRSGRPLLERPETVVKFSRTEQHGGAPAHEDEPRCDERAEQQAPALQGPVLLPPPPVDYGVFMQGLVQAMQTQAHTQAALQAQLEAQTHYLLRRTGIVGDDTLAEEAVETDSERGD